MSFVAASPTSMRHTFIGEDKDVRFAEFCDVIEDNASDTNTAGLDIDLRQLRHHTKNTLQRILGLISDTPGLRGTLEGEKIVQDLEYRISLSVTISNALFGFTDLPGSMAERLRALAGPVVGMLRDPDQVIRIGVSVRGRCPAALRLTVLRSAHELISNAVKHGMKGRPDGRIAVRLTTDENCTILTVADNGWGFAGTPHPGGGLSITREFATRHGGSLVIDGESGTVATLELPHAYVALATHEVLDLV